MRKKKHQDIWRQSGNGSAMPIKAGEMALGKAAYTTSRKAAALLAQA